MVGTVVHPLSAAFDVGVLPPGRPARVSAAWHEVQTPVAGLSAEPSTSLVPVQVLALTVSRPVVQGDNGVVLLFLVHWLVWLVLPTVPPVSELSLRLLGPGRQETSHKSVHLRPPLWLALPVLIPVFVVHLPQLVDQVLRQCRL